MFYLKINQSKKWYTSISITLKYNDFAKYFTASAECLLIPAGN